SPDRGHDDLPDWWDGVRLDLLSRVGTSPTLLLTGGPEQPGTGAAPALPGASRRRPWRRRGRGSPGAVRRTGVYVLGAVDAGRGVQVSSRSGAGLSPASLRAAELIGALSLATDFGVGEPLEHGLRTTVIGVRLAESLGPACSASDRAPA